jgi:protein MPE1
LLIADGFYANRGLLSLIKWKLGHFIQNCPTIGDSNFDKVIVKRTTGIPKMFLKAVDEKDPRAQSGPGKGLMVTQNGELVVATPNRYV